MKQADVAKILDANKATVSRTRKTAIKAGWMTGENKLTLAGATALKGEK